VNEDSKAIDIYKELGVEKDSSSQTVHKHFLRLVGSLLRKIKSGQKSDQLMDELRTLWVSHDILIDPDCRTDYDLRSLGIITNDTNEEYEPSSIAYALGTGPKSKYPSWRIGELLQAVGLLEQAELTIACDMHKAMPEMQFGRFLVKQDFLTEKQLQAVLTGQILIRAGEITLTQFVNVMTEVNITNRNFKEVLLASGYLKNPTLLKLDNDT
jgi:hypothetical protein